MRRALLLLARFGLVALGSSIALVALVAGMLAPTTEATLSWVIVEFVGVAVLIPGLHIAIEWDLR